MYSDFYRMRKDAFTDEPSVELFFKSKPHSFALEAITAWSGSATPTLLVLGEKGSGKTLMALKLADLLSDCDEPSCVFIAAVNTRLTIESLIGPEKKTSQTRLTGEKETDMENIWSEIGNHLGISNESGSSPYEFVREHLTCADTLRSLHVIVDDAHNLPALAVQQLEDLAALKTGEDHRLRLAIFSLPGTVPLDPATDNSPAAARNVVALGKLSREETSEYIYYRLCQSGSPGVPSFSEDALDAIHDLTGGNPLLINRICRHALTTGAAVKVMIVDRNIVLDQNYNNSTRGETDRSDSASAGQIAGEGSRKNIGLRVFVIFACAMLVTMLLAIVLDFKRFFMLFF